LFLPFSKLYLQLVSIMMKTILTTILLGASVSLMAQGPKGKPAKMAALFSPGYYVSTKGDTVRGEVQSNHETEVLFYQKLFFKAKGAAKPAEISDKKAKGYGYNDNHFMLVPFDEQTNVFIKYLVKGRLNFFEYKYTEIEAGKEVTRSIFYIQDTKADEENKSLRELTKVSQNFYKKDLKPFMKDQPMMWSDFDKFKFDLPQIVNSLKEYNKLYEN
jgi:hypothetical protein